jgi:hypothetical protein
MRTGVKLVRVVVLGLLGLAAGCGPEIPVEELGKVEFQVPDLPRAEGAFPLPPEVIAAKERYTGEQGAEEHH